jgi:hypothetical protein
VSSDDPDDLRRVRLAALARQERKVAAAAAQAARKREATRAPGDAASLSVVGQAATRPSNIQSSVDEDSVAGGDLAKADDFDDATEMATTTARVTAEADLSAAAAAAANTPGQITSAELFILATTVQLVVRNARERPDRRSLKAANDGVWTKVCEKSLPSSFLDNEDYEPEDYAPMNMEQRVRQMDLPTHPSLAFFMRTSSKYRWCVGRWAANSLGSRASPPLLCLAPASAAWALAAALTMTRRLSQRQIQTWLRGGQRPCILSEVWRKMIALAAAAAAVPTTQPLKQMVPPWPTPPIQLGWPVLPLLKKYSRHGLHKIKHSRQATEV